MRKRILLLLVVLSLLFLVGCAKDATPAEEDDIPLPPEPQPPGQMAENLDVMTVVECEALQGSTVNVVGGYDCEQGEMPIGVIEELTGDHVCCIA